MRQHSDAIVAYLRSEEVRLRRLAHALTRSREDAEDLLQETVVRLGQAWDRIDDRGPGAYATTTMVRLSQRTSMRTQRRRHLMLAQAGDPTSSPADHSRTPDHTESLVLREAVRALPPRQRAVIALRYLCDQSVEDTARTLDVTEGTVKSQTSKALRALAGAFPDAAPEGAGRTTTPRLDTTGEKP